MVKIIILWKPMSVNQTYARSKFSFYMTAKWKEYKEETIQQALQQYKKKPLEWNIEVEFKYYFADNRVHDHLNFNKCLNDALTWIVWLDDKQIKISHHYTLKDSINPRIELMIKTIW